jgi:hypothetical protein
VHEAQEKVVNVNIIIVSWGSAIGKLIIVGDVLPNYLRLFLGVDLGDLAYSWSPAPSSSEWDVVRDKLAWAHFDSPALLPLLPIMFYVYSAHISIFPLYQELQPQDGKRMQRILFTDCVILFLFYSALGACCVVCVRVRVRVCVRVACVACVSCVY